MSATRAALRYPGRCDGIDVSSVQIITDAQAVADDGFVFACVKASEGVSYCDPRALEHLAKLRDVGLFCNVYTFLRPSQGKPRAQVERALSCAGDIFPGRLMLDAEGAPNGMPPGEIVGFYEECADEALSFGALEPEVYTFPDFTKTRLQPALGRSTRLARCPLHMAFYGPGGAWVPASDARPFLCAPWSTWTRWQYSGDGGFRVRGIAGDVDRNLFNGDLAALRRYMGYPEDRPTTPDPVIRPALGWELPPPREV